jgi:hypothetical protein
VITLHVYRAIDQFGQVVDVPASEKRNLIWVIQDRP